MGKEHEKPLFELTAPECAESIASVFAATGASRPLATTFAAAVMLANAATRRVAVASLDRMDRTGNIEWPEFHQLPPDIFEYVEGLNNDLLEGQPARIDSVAWDGLGYVHGWFKDKKGRRDRKRGSCPEVVMKLADALDALATCDDEWQPLLQRYAGSLRELWSQGREKAEIVARERVAEQGWWAKRFKRTSIEKELLRLGYSASSPSGPESGLA
jgi:hypothetical protein